MGNTAYTYRLKSVECDQCGGPVVSDVSAVEAECSYCHAKLRLVARAKHAAHTPIDEEARMAGLAEQVRRQDPDGPLADRPPEGMQAFAAMLTQEEARPAAVEAFRQEWTQARADATERPSRGTGTRAFRAALYLARLYAANGDHPRARAVVETAIHIVSDPGQRDILRLWLARAAVGAGDAESYEEWLGEVNPQPVHLEVDSALRLTRARRALADQRYSDVFPLVGTYPTEVPLAVGADEAGRFVRAHAFAGKGDEVSARRELRGVLGTAQNPHELARVLLGEYPGPAARIAEEEAQQPRQAAANAVTHAAAAQAMAQVAPRMRRSAKRAGLMAGCASLLPMGGMLIFFVPMIAPALFLESCGLGPVEEQIMASIEACPAATAALGANVSPAPGWSCGNLETGGGNGHANWSFAVSGSDGRGSVSFNAVEQFGTWHLGLAVLEVGDETIDLLTCGGGHGIGQPVFVPPVPGAPVGAGGNLGGTLATMEEGCAAGNAQICFGLGEMYRNVPQFRDEAKAAELYSRACEGGFEPGCAALRHRTLALRGRTAGSFDVEDPADRRSAIDGAAGMHDEVVANLDGALSVGVAAEDRQAAIGVFLGRRDQHIADGGAGQPGQELRVAHVTLVPARLAKGRDVGRHHDLGVPGAGVGEDRAKSSGLRVPESTQSPNDLRVVVDDEFLDQAHVFESYAGVLPVADASVAPAVDADEGGARREFDDSHRREPGEPRVLLREFTDHAPDPGDRGSIIVVIAEDEVEGASDLGLKVGQVPGQLGSLRDVPGHQDRIWVVGRDSAPELGALFGRKKVQVDVRRPAQAHGSHYATVASAGPPPKSLRAWWHPLQSGTS